MLAPVPIPSPRIRPPEPRTPLPLYRGDFPSLLELLRKALSKTGEDIPVSASDPTTVAQAILDRAAKAPNPAAGNLAALDASGNPVDSGKKPSDFQAKLTFDTTPTAGSQNPVTSGGVKSAIDAAIPSDYEQVKAQVSQNTSDIVTVDEKIPSQASAQNQLADKDFVNSSIATNTATFRGTYNLVSDLGLTTSATERQVAAAIATKLAALSITPEHNDYCFVQVPRTDAEPTTIVRIDRYKCSVEDGVASWGYEWSLNNSSFTANQWAAINSGITSGLVAKLGALPTAEALAAALAGKADVDYVWRNFANLQIIAWPYSSANTYNKGDYCIHDYGTTVKALCRCKVDNTTGYWYSENWDIVRLANEVVLKSIHSETPEFGKWTISQNPDYRVPMYGLYYAPIGAEYEEAGLPSADTEVWWFDMTGAREGIWTTETNSAATSVSGVMPLEFPDHTENIALTGTRTVTYPVIAYQLGGNSDKLLQPKGEYAPASNIAKSALSSEVQTSLGKADTALQTAPVTSVNSKTGAISLSASDVGVVIARISDGSMDIRVGNESVNVKNIYLSTNSDGNTVIWLGAEEYAVIPAIDSTPTHHSNHAVSSGGVFAALALKAPLASPAFTGTPTAPTPASGDNSTKVATTEFVKTAISGISVTPLSGQTFDFATTQGVMDALKTVIEALGGTVVNAPSTAISQGE